METTLIREQKGGAVEVEFAKMSDEELRRMVWVFPEAQRIYLERFLKTNMADPTIPTSG